MSNDELIQHPIQLSYLGAAELSITAHVPPKGSKGLGDDAPITIGASHSPFDEDTNTISVIVKASHKATQNEETGKWSHPYSISIELRALFEVDTDRFPKEKVTDWACGNSKYILMPYLREHLYALTQRCGFEPFTIPLLEVPTYQIAPPKEAMPSDQN